MSGTTTIPNESTHIDGQVVDNNNRAISNAIEVFGKTGRFPTTDTQGKFSMLVYARADNYISTPTGQFQLAQSPLVPTINSQDMIVYYNGTNVNINNDPQTSGVILTSATGFNTTTPFTLPQLFQILANSNPFGKALKRGGIYPIAIRGKDADGRLTTMNTNQDCIVYIPF